MNERPIRTIERPTCPLCHSEGTVLYRDLRDRLFGAPGLWNIRRCPNESCALLWLDPIPAPEDLPLVYVEYFTHKDKPAERGGIVHWLYRCLVTLTGLAQQRAELRLFFLRNRPPVRLLEVGCGNGERLLELQRLGWTVEGQEVDPAAAARARERGLRIHLGEMHTLPLSENDFGAVVMNHVLEHVADPVALLRQCRRVLKAGGYFGAVTPNADSLGRRRFGAAWMALDPPRHLHLFPASTLQRLAEEAGFRQCRVWTSAANAQFVAEGSLAIQRTGQHRLGTRPAVGIIGRSLLFQLQASVALRREPFSGEESILTATK